MTCTCTETTLDLGAEHSEGCPQMARAKNEAERIDAQRQRYLADKVQDRGYPGMTGGSEVPTSGITVESVAQHSGVMQKAMDIYIKRSEARGELWAEFDVEDALHNARSKLARAKAATDRDLSTQHIREEALDSLYDLINYAAFAVRHITGEKPS